MILARRPDAATVDVTLADGSGIDVVREVVASRPDAGALLYTGGVVGEDLLREELGLLAAGLTGEEIAQRLVLSPETVQTHVRNLMRRLDARTRVHALAIALRHGEVEVTA